jgi:hypothetical protein
MRTFSFIYLRRICNLWGPVKFWKNPLFIMVGEHQEEGEGYVPHNPVTFEFPIRDTEGTTQDEKYPTCCFTPFPWAK